MTEKTAETYRQRAAAARQRSRESFERCDTDGCVSQFANDLGARLDDLKANLVENGKRSIFRGLYQGERRVKARQVETKWGMTWVLHDDEVEKFGRRFVPTGERSRIQKEMGLAERREWAPAWAVMAGSGYGFSGLATCRPITFRTGDKWGQDAELVEEEK